MDADPYSPNAVWIYAVQFHRLRADGSVRFGCRAMR